MEVYLGDDTLWLAESRRNNNALEESTSVESERETCISSCSGTYTNTVNTTHPDKCRTYRGAAAGCSTSPPTRRWPLESCSPSHSPLSRRSPPPSSVWRESSIVCNLVPAAPQWLLWAKHKPRPFYLSPGKLLPCWNWPNLHTGIWLADISGQYLLNV